MTIQRQYSLPNCRLILEGLSEQPPLGANVQPLMSILLNAQCYVTGLEQPVSGGLDFFQSLVTAVSHYAQEMLSGVRSPILLSNNGSGEQPHQGTWVNLEAIPGNLHRLTVLSGDPGHQSAPIQVDLTTVQLFDLIEAVDQFFADKSTLPALTLSLAPVSKKYLRTQEPVAKKVVPLAVGVSGLAIAATAFFMAPIPEIKRPTEDPVTQSTRNEITDGKTAGSSGANQPPGTANSGKPLSASELETLLAQTPEITDPTRLTILQQQLRNQLVETWTTPATFTEPLIYQVSVAKDGAIVGYKAENDAARDYVEQTPLSQILYKPADGGTTQVEEIGLFKVVLEPNGVPEVSPYRGLTGRPSPPPEIQDPALVETLFKQLRDNLINEWKTTPTFQRDLIYKVLVTEDGAIADYEAQNQPARDYLSETPLRQLHQPSAALKKDSDGNLAYVPVVSYRVVFTPRQVLEVTPWNGW
jgi:hypothetical protein